MSVEVGQAWQAASAWPAVSRGVSHRSAVRCLAGLSAGTKAGASALTPSGPGWWTALMAAPWRCGSPARPARCLTGGMAWRVRAPCRSPLQARSRARRSLLVLLGRWPVAVPAHVPRLEAWSGLSGGQGRPWRSKVPMQARSDEFGDGVAQASQVGVQTRHQAAAACCGDTGPRWPAELRARRLVTAVRLSP